MERSEEKRSRAGLLDHGAPGPIAALAALTLLATLLVACQQAETDVTPQPEPYLWLVPCGEEIQVQWSGSAEWQVVDAPITVDREARIVAEGADSGRLCAADGSVFELGPGTALDVGPAEEASRLQMSLQEGNLLFLAVAAPYQFAAPGCLLRISEVPARVSVALNSEATRLRVEQGVATLVVDGETITVETCAEIIAAPGAEPQIGQYCATPQPTPTIVTLPTDTPTPTPTPTLTPSVTPTPSTTPTPTPTPRPTRRPTRRPTATNTPPPPTNTIPPPPDTRVPPTDTPEL